MDTRDTPAIARRSPLALCLAAALALGTTSGTAVTLDGLPIPLRTGELLPAHLLPNGGAGPRLHHDTPHPNGGILIPVTSCADDGSEGTFRHAVLIASNGDTVDLSALTCSTITLASGAVSVDVEDLDIIGPGAGALSIDGAYADRVIRHGGAGDLSISGVTLTHGSYTTPDTTALHGGGCLYSMGNISLFGVVVSSCAMSGDTYVVGGGVLALGNVLMFNSTITHSSAVALVGGTTSAAVGGGVVAVGALVFEHSTLSGNLVSTSSGNAYAGGGFAANGLTAKYSNVTGNTAFTLSPEGSAYYALGGGMFAVDGFIQNTTFDYNTADAGGAIYLRGGASPVTFRSSTISNNHASLLGGAMFANTDIGLYNTTIAFNESGPRGGGGVFVTETAAELVSTLIANNSPSGTDAAADFDGPAVVVSGSNNLVKISGVAMPGDTITLDPQLLPLAWNGGETRTHAIPSTSPAHDVGLNPNGLDFDQRGPGYPRVDAIDPDIGAYELNPDIIFVDGFGGT